MPIRPKREQWVEETREGAVIAAQEADSDPDDDVPPKDGEPGLDPPCDEPAEG